MGWMDSLAKRSVQSGNLVTVAQWPRPSQSTISDAGKEVSPSTALTQATVFACVRHLSATMGAMTLDLFKLDRKNDSRERAIRHNVFRVLQRPNPHMTRFHWIQSKVAHICMTGNAYSQIVRDDAMRLTGLYLLSPLRMKVWIAPDTDEIFYEYTTYPTGESRFFKREEINHWMYLTIDGITGMNPIEYARNTIGLSMARDQFNAKLIENGAAPVGALTYPQKMSEEGMKKVRDSWELMHRGSRNAGRIAILDNGIKYESIGINPVDMEWAAMEERGPIEICKFFGVDPKSIFEGSDQGKLVDAQIRERQHTFMPLSNALEQCMDRDLLLFDDRNNYFSEFNLDSLERADKESRTNTHRTSILIGLRSRNECRREENLGMLDPEIGDVYLSPLNMVPAELAPKIAEAQIQKMLKPDNAGKQDPMDPTQADKTDAQKDDQAQKRARKASKRALSEAFSRVFTKELRKIEQLSKVLSENGGFSEFEGRLTDFYQEQRGTFAEMLLPAVIGARELVEDITPTAEMRCKEDSQRLAEQYIDRSIEELRRCIEKRGNILRTFQDWEKLRPASEADQVVAIIFGGEEAA